MTDEVSCHAFVFIDGLLENITICVRLFNKETVPMRFYENYPSSSNPKRGGLLRLLVHDRLIKLIFLFIIMSCPDISTSLLPLLWKKHLAMDTIRLSLHMTCKSDNIGKT